MKPEFAKVEPAKRDYCKVCSCPKLVELTDKDFCSDHVNTIGNRAKACKAGRDAVVAFAAIHGITRCDWCDTAVKEHRVKAN
jgi:hypothetical protein